MATVVKEKETGACASTQSNDSEEREGKSEKTSDLELAYKDQGYHEMEFTSGNESELHERKEQCLKNPGHSTFIPATTFTMDHLPECWRDSLVFDLITSLIGLTVRLAVKYTSKERPPNYPLYNRRGQCGLTAYGSGRIWRISRSFTEKDGHTCPCKTCQQSPHLAKTQWGEFWVSTAMHVIFDSSEASHTRCDLFFDSDEDSSNCPNLEGVNVWYSDIEEDRCYLTCVTHDEDVSNKLERIWSRYRKVWDEVKEKYSTPGHTDRKNTVVVISHPHGLCKHVTVGDVTHTAEDGYDKWIYSAETCPGSSGGHVCILKNWKGRGRQSAPCRATHSGCQFRGQNESTVFWLSI